MFVSGVTTMRLSILCILALLTGPMFHLADSRSAMAREITLQQESATENLMALRIMVAKLRELVINLKDVDDLEKIGLSHSDAQLMRLALQEKINQTQQETLEIIWRL